jgi:hypothetical protein
MRDELKKLELAFQDGLNEVTTQEALKELE